MGEQIENGYRQRAVADGQLQYCCSRGGRSVESSSAFADSWHLSDGHDDVRGAILEFLVPDDWGSDLPTEQDAPVEG